MQHKEYTIGSVMKKPRIAVLIPCFNESATIEQVIHDFRASLPEATIFVYDNQSSDNSIELAKKSGAEVKSVSNLGKGYVVRRMFADIEADIYVMVDGDATYDATAAKKAIYMLQNDGLDMVICVREPVANHSFRPGHKIGNQCFTSSINFLFKQHLSDIFSGYRVFSRRFVKSFPAISNGFEIETEITVHALQLDMPITEIKTPYRERPLGSLSKLKTISDGLKISRTLFSLYISVRPIAVFGSLFFALFTLSVILGIPIVTDFIQTGLVPRIPTAIIVVCIGILAALCLACGIVLDSISRSRLETKKLWYLLFPTMRSSEIE